MALNIKNEEAHRLARELATETKTSLTEAVVIALQERLAVVRRAQKRTVRDEVNRIQEFVASLPDLDGRSADEIIGYDESGLPT